MGGGGGGGSHSERVDGEIEEKTHTHNVKTINKHLDKKRERYFIDLKGSICKVINKDWLSNIKPRASHIRRRTLPEVDSSLSDLIQETFPVVLNNNIHRRVSQARRLAFRSVFVLFKTRHVLRRPGPALLRMYPYFHIGSSHRTNCKEGK